MPNYVVIGASSGIGRQISLQLSEAGHRIYATYHTHRFADESSISYHALNVLDPEPDFSFLPPQIDGLVYCPGCIELKPFHRIKAEDFIADYQLQVLGAVRSIQASLGGLKASGNASIVLFSTIAVQTGMSFHSMIAASKGAIEGLSRALAAEYAPAIRVNCIAPSLTDTPLAERLLQSEDKRQANAVKHPLKRIGQTSDIAHMTEFLLSPKSSWITGQIFHVDGGLSSLKV